MVFDDNDEIIDVSTEIMTGKKNCEINTILWKLQSQIGWKREHSSPIKTEYIRTLEICDSTKSL